MSDRARDAFGPNLLSALASAGGAMAPLGRCAGGVLLIAALVGCTNIQVEPLDPQLAVERICIEENPDVIVPRFVEILREGFRRHGIETEVYSQELPESCRYRLTYTARQSWDAVTYLSYAELALFDRGTQVAYAELDYGGYDFDKYRATETKMNPVIDRLLAGY